MIRKTYRAAALGLGLVAALGLGCGGPADTGAPTDTAAPATDTIDAVPAEPTGEPAADPLPAEGEGEGEGETAAAEVTLSEEDIAQIEKLSAEDQALALAQKVCPITGEALGSMGMPIKVMAGEKPVFLCCEGCTEEFEKDPAAALAKLEQK